MQIESGKLIGSYFNTAKGRKVLSFLGVPYAAPPVNEFRFKEPQPVLPWDGKKDANEMIKQCSQLDHTRIALNRLKYIMGEEDCLYLNIYTPKLYNNNNTELFDVVVFIHGGAFMYGSGRGYKPKYLLDKTDLVFVSINYRLGPFGFITMDDNIIPGNNGLKDQVFALKWIQRNIKQFSGDPDKVTITGLSAGGASVHYHYLSKQSIKLFNKGISLSGVSTNPWALMENGKSKTIRLADSLNCKTDNSLILIECLKNRTDNEILMKTKELFMPWLYNPFSPFGPTIEVSGNEPFLNKDPYEILKDGEFKNAPWLTSVTSEEGLYPAAEFVNDEKLLNELNNNWYDIAPHLLDFNFTVPVSEQNVISKKILQHYFKNNTISLNTSKEIIDMLSDRLFLADIGKSIKMQAIPPNSKIYMYKFSFRATFSISDILSKSKKNFGVSHGDDLPFILGCYFDGVDQRPGEKEIMDKMLNMWISFIKYGRPDLGDKSIWNPASNLKDDSINYLDIKSDQNIKMVKDNNFGNKDFWDSLSI